MQNKLALFILLLVCPFVQGGDTLKDARLTLLRGNYAEARQIYEKLAKNPQLRSAAVVGLSKAMQSEGEYDAALKTVADALKELPKNADLLARQADLYYLRGRWDDAEKSAKEALKIAEENFAARWVLGRLYRDRGDLEKADEEFRWFIRTYKQRSDDDKEITDPDELLLVGLAGIERARFHNLSDQFQFILDEVFGEAVKNDKAFWPAEYEAGRLRHEKNDKARADAAFDRALILNANAAEVLTAKGLAAFQRFEMQDAENFADRALKINPRLTEALRLKADVLLFGGQTSKALAELAKAREVNPHEEQTLALIASIAHQQKQAAEFDALTKEVQSFDSKPAIFYFELAESLEQRKFFEDAEKFYLRANELQPKLPWSQNGLGLLYMRLGKEDLAKKTLEKAFEADPFNIRVGNTLKVLDHLEKYETLKTKHFLIRFDPKNDKVLANFMAKYLEDIHTELAERFQYRPAGPILIEIFNKHEMFSGRITAMPDLHTIGACTGPMFAMVSPRDKSKVIGKPFNWVRVIRHELVHIFNLDQTKYQIPHWFTEGLAVQNEGFATPQRWQLILAEKMQANELLNLDNILLAFARPRSPDQWHQAYLQSDLYVTYVTKTYGDAAIGKLLAAYADGLDTDHALERTFNVKKAEFEKGYRKFLEERVQKDQKGARKTLGMKALKQALEKNPEDADLTAQLADRFFSAGNKKEAKKLADQALTLKRNHPLAAYVKAMLLNDSGDSDIAFDLLKRAADEECTEIKPLKLLSRMYFENKDLTRAAQALEQCRKLEPGDPSWLPQLAKVYGQAGDNDKLEGVLKDLAATDPDDLLSRRKLAAMAKAAERHADAERYARQALEIDVLDKECREILLESLMAQNKDAELKEFRKLFEE
ncbi:MAG: tetratricopeptide repeat protein [Planctomycetes bacterium]|nr:tetratricopeptide repeat protein [Planctomycetota bacterium]